MEHQQHYFAGQEAFPPPLPNHLCPSYSPALTTMEQFTADLLRMDEEHLKHRKPSTPETPSTPEVPSPSEIPSVPEVPSPSRKPSEITFFPDDELPSDYTLWGTMRTWYRRLSRRSSRGSDVSL
ncbi:hypothetical protein AA0117_g9220 [Alternaria alternata]|uniref:Uncharacterized protein n=1 Tax=Alternaria alternata TaxID=5599 RepID=A0A4Q4N7A7_ALTAL|nr:hypothetical protein AA0117_g9220 [Alternaria alternata]